MFTKNYNKKIERIDNAILSLLNLTEIIRVKNIILKNSFSDEFFKKLKNYISLD